jgi:hypothetical protein
MKKPTKEKMDYIKKNSGPKPDKTGMKTPKKPKTR